MKFPLVNVWILSALLSIQLFPCTDGNQRLILSDNSLKKRRDASETEVQVLGGVETSWKRMFQDRPVWRGHKPLQPGDQRVGEVQ